MQESTKFLPHCAFKQIRLAPKICTLYFFFSVGFASAFCFSYNMKSNFQVRKPVMVLICCDLLMCKKEYPKIASSLNIGKVGYQMSFLSSLEGFCTAVQLFANYYNLETLQAMSCVLKERLKAQIWQISTENAWS